MEVNKKILLLAPGNLDPKMTIFDTIEDALAAIPEWQRERGMIVKVKSGMTVKEYWWEDDDLSDLAVVEKSGGAGTPVEEQILAASAKETPADADTFGYVDSAEGSEGILRKFTWANLKAALKGYFDGIYSTFFPDDTGDGTKFLSDAGDYREAGGGGGGGHTIKDNEGTALTQRDTLKFSGFLTAVDNATTEETEADIDPEQVEEYEEVPIFQVPITVRALLEDTGNWTAKVYTGAAIAGAVAGMIHYDSDYMFLFVTDTTPIRIARS